MSTTENTVSQDHLSSGFCYPNAFADKSYVRFAQWKVGGDSQKSADSEPIDGLVPNISELAVDCNFEKSLVLRDSFQQSMSSSQG